MSRKAFFCGRAGGAVCLLLFVLLLVVRSQPAQEAAKPALPPDLAKIPSDAVFLVSGRIADLWNSEVNKSVRQKFAKEVNEGAGEFEKQFGLSMDQVERFSMAMLHVEERPPKPLLFVGTTKAYNRGNVTGAIAAKKEEKYKQQTLFVKAEDWAVYPFADRALAYGSRSALQELIDHETKSEGNLAAALRLASEKHSAVFAMNVKSFNDAFGDKLPGDTEPFKPLLQALSGTLTVDLGAESRAEVKLTFANEKDANAAADPARAALVLARVGLGRGVEQLAKEKEMATFVELLKNAQESLKTTQVEQESKTLKAAAQLKVDVATFGLILLEQVQKMREAAARAQSSNNLKQIALAMHNYHDSHGSFPPQATYDKNGKPLLSWRVMILPFLEQNDLYGQFHLDEPWNSEHNKKLIAKMPTVYASPRDEKAVADHMTHYQGFYGKGAFFEGKQGKRITDFIDGTSNTLMIVEASKAVPWTKPEDIPYDPAKPLPKLDMKGANRFLAALCDGSVRFFSHKIPENTLHLLIQRNDGMPIPNDF